MQNKTNYEKCKMEKMDTIMKEYESGKLKSRGTTYVKNRKQAIAIGLSISEKQCSNKFSKKDVEKIENKLQKTIYKKGEYDKLPLTHIKDGKLLAQYYNNKKQYTKSKKLKQQILNHSIKYVKHNLKNNDKITKQILNEISNIKF